ncbi:NAD(P)/FAD-dependent oxidoreductase [Candidatus Pelagibacter bacterium]|jgi:hypothetical protein|nr:NAD(P)/FAD-dependent oxidoreductase [Candidatus Pelagibacter bacterium]
MKKKISIIGGSLYGCLLAYYLNSKKYDVTIYEKSNKLLSGFNSIQIGKYKLNNGFHGFEYPRTKQLINFLQNKVDLKLRKIPNIRKLLINREIIDYTAKFNEFPNNIKILYKKKNLKNYKNQNFKFFFKKNFSKKIEKNSRRFTDDIEMSKHLFLPWFLPSDVKHLSKDEGHLFRSLVRNKKIIPSYYIPKNDLFETISKSFLKKFKEKKIKINLNSNVSIYKNKIIIKDKKDKYEQKIKESKMIFCGSPIIFLNYLKPKMLFDLKKYKRNFYNVLIKIPKKNNTLPYFSELLCLNDKICNVNRISRAIHLEDCNNFFIQLEVILKNIKLIDASVNKIKIELSKIFNLKNHKIIGYKHSRVIYSPKKDWLKKAEKILKRFVTENDIQVDNRSFEPINTSKVWNLLKHNIRKYKI